jgi:APA family basic amino acid/polyamine antiporter
VLSVVALIATGNTVLLLLATGARLLYGMARRGLLPATLARLAPRRRTPWVATLVATAAALGFALAGEVGFVAQVTNFAVFVAFAIVNAAVIRLRLRQPDRPRPFRLPLTVRGVPATAALGGAAALGLMLSLDRGAFAAGAATLALGAALSFVMLRRPPEAGPGAAPGTPP